eukprot:766482-Hanusia_phi.AAC.7
MLRILKQFVDDGRISDGADVSKLRFVRHSCSDSSQDPAHNFAAPRLAGGHKSTRYGEMPYLRQARGKLDLVRSGKGSNLRPDNLCVQTGNVKLEICRQGGMFDTQVAHHVTCGTAMR